MKSALAVAALLCSLLVTAEASLSRSEQCSRTMVDHFNQSPRDFAGKLLACQIRGHADEHCCSLTKSVFADGGVLDNCLCSSNFLSMILDSVPNAGIMPEFAVNMWKRCDIPVSGGSMCPGTEEGPAVTGQGLLSKALGAKALLAKAFTKSTVVGGLLSAGSQEEEEAYEEHTDDSEVHYVYEESPVHYVEVTPAYIEVPGEPVEVPVPVPTPVEVPGPPVEIPVPVPTPVEVPGPPVEIPVPVPTPVEVPGPPVEIPVPVPTPVEVPGPPVEVSVPVPTPVEVPSSPVEVPVPTAVEVPAVTPEAVPQAPLEVTVDVSTPAFIPPPGEDKLTGASRVEYGEETWNAAVDGDYGAETAEVPQGVVDTSTEQFVDTSTQLVDPSQQQSVVVDEATDQYTEETVQILESPEVSGAEEVVEPVIQETVEPVPQEVAETGAFFEGTATTADGSATATAEQSVVGEAQNIQGAYAGRRLRFL